MKIAPYLEENFEYFKKIRHHLHSIPEIGFEEFETSKFIYKELEKLGIPYEYPIAKTGIIATIKCSNTPKYIAFRADMDALKIDEKNDFGHCSQNQGLMHACGHDGHSTTLLAFASLVMQNKELFDGTIYCIFQPAEEGLGGAKAMLDEKILDRYKIDKIFGYHNRPTEEFGKIFIQEGIMMASYDNYEIVVHGKSTHSSMPHTGKNPIVAAAHIVTALKSITSLDIDPLEKSVVTVAKISGGEALNIIPSSCTIAGSIRSYDAKVRNRIEQRVQQIAKSIGEAFEMQVSVNYKKGYPSTVNSDVSSAKQAAINTVGSENLIENFEPSFGSEDFSYFLEQIPGCYAWLGAHVNGDKTTLHSNNYDFNDELIKIGANYFYEIAKLELAKN